MTPRPALVAELHLVLVNAESDALILRTALQAQGELPYGVREDHRANVIGEIFAAIERVEPGLGQRLQAACYPCIDTEESPT